MNANRTARIRQSLAALAMALTTALGLLSAMGQIADRYHDDEHVAQGAAPAASQQVVLTVGAKRS